MFAALDLGLIYGLVALGAHLTLRVLGVVDLIVDSSSTTGAAVAAVMITTGQNPWLTIPDGFLAGCVAGTVTDLLHANAGIHPLLAGILIQASLCSTDLRILGEANAPLLHGVETLLTPLHDKGLLGSWVSVFIFTALIAIVITLFNWLLPIQIGLRMCSTGDNEGMTHVQEASIGTMKIIGLVLSNGLVVSSGAIITQYQSYVDISMGIGLIVTGLASVITGTALAGSQGVWVIFFFVIIGSIMYRVIIQPVLGVELLEVNGMKLISVIIVFVALTTPWIGIFPEAHECRRSRSLVPEPDIVYTSEECDNEKAVF